MAGRWDTGRGGAADSHTCSGREHEFRRGAGTDREGSRKYRWASRKGDCPDKKRARLILTERQQMGLDAVVYRNRMKLGFDAEKAGALYDSRTGETYFEGEAGEARVPDATLVALSRRLGNVAGIELLSDMVTRALGRRDSLLRRKVLFSGTHAGDVIESNDFSQLAAEMEEISQYAALSENVLLVGFLRDMEELIQAAVREENPIVFT